MLYFKIFNSKNKDNKLIELLDFFKSKEPPVFPIKAKNLMKTYKVSEGKMLGIQLKKIERIWINNNFEISEKEILNVLDN